MDQIQQEIRAFHERITPILHTILAQYGPRNTQKIYLTVLRPCRRLLQKCSCKSIADTSRYCSLAYWLYIYGNQPLALALCEAAHGVDFTFEFQYWQGGIQNIYGLEIRIARELLGEDRRDVVPSALLDYYCSKSVKKVMRYPQVLLEREIAAHDGKLFDAEMLRALFYLIGHGETGLYTELNQHWDEIEQTIRLYIDCLKME